MATTNTARFAVLLILSLVSGREAANIPAFDAFQVPWQQVGTNFPCFRKEASPTTSFPTRRSCLPPSVCLCRCPPVLPTLMSSMGGVAGEDNEQMSPAPYTDPKDLLRVNVLGLGDGEADGEIGTLFVGPYDEMYVSEDGGAWGSLKAFPRALPIPLASKEDLALLSGLDGLGTADQRSIKLNADEIEQVLSVTRELCSGLPFTKPPLSDAIKRVFHSEQGIRTSRLDALEQLVSLCRCSLQRLVLDETDSLTDKDLSLGCYVVLKQETGMVYGHATYADDEMRVWVPIPSGIALATHLGIPILLPKYIWQEAACRVDTNASMQSSAYPKDGRLCGMMIHSAQPAGWRTPLTPNKLAARARSAELGRNVVDVPEQLQGIPAWQVAANVVIKISEDELRALLRSYKVPCKRGQRREELLKKLQPLMDEVERRAVQIQLAVEEEDYEAANAAKALRSQRASLSDEIKRAVEEQRFYDASGLQNQLDVLTMARADVTAEDGSYDRFLDADGWYMESIMRSKKAKLERQKRSEQR